MKRVDPVAAAAALLGAVVVLYATSSWGAAVFQLGLHNVTAAQALLDGRVMCTTRGEPFTQWPPLLPAILAIGRKLGLDYGTTASWLNAASLAATVLASWALLARTFQSRLVAVLGASCFIAFPVVFEHTATLSSEPLFIALALGALVCALEQIERPRPAALAALIACSALACLQRYVGVVLVGVVGAMLLLGSRDAARWKRAAVYGVLSLAPLCVWLARNHFLVGQATGERVEPNEGLARNLQDAGKVLLDWWLAPSETTPLLAFSGWFLGLLALAAFLRPFALDDPRREGRALALYAAFPLTYLAFVIVVSSVVFLDPLDQRLLYPTMPFALGLAFAGADGLVRFAGKLGGAVKWSLVVLLGLGFAGVLEEAAKTTALMAANARENGFGSFGSRASNQSELVRWLREHPLDAIPRSNFPEVVAFATHRPAKLVPSVGVAKALAAIDPSEAPFVLIWIPTPGGAFPNALRPGTRDGIGIEVLADLADGKVMRVTIDASARGANGD